MSKKFLDIVDPIHGFVRAGRHELPIIDSPEFQRLRRIRQLSGAHLVYPGAQHTRFEHSLGVMHIAGMAGDALCEKGFLRQDDVPLLRLAGLLHDIGHGPFSHLFEEVARGRKVSHEDIGRGIILGSGIGDMLSRAGYEKGLVTRIAFGDSKFRLMNEVISGALSADMMDYLLRDGYFTGAEHARIDHRRITRSFGRHKGRLALEASALHSFESMVHSRYQMFKAVYFHKTVRAAEVMLLEALRLADGEFGFTSLGPSEYVGMTDEHVLTTLLSSKLPSLRRARRLAADYQDRRLLKCVFERVVTARRRLESIRPAELRADLSRKSGVPEEEIFVDSSATPSIPLAPSKSESTSIFLLGGRGAGEMPISEIPLVSAISGFMNVLRVYTRSAHRKKVEIAAGSILGGLK